ncbi:hypothetical protein PIB30_090443 [Stylosanthes scabra]|uniref:Uncharacterized protein n=1 Tax=Stylosanthes scabra TaxID=79078 RepID=A0ABU6RUM0_9FABA|nr:hypothetical protein [Stylosanthes scabra]
MSSSSSLWTIATLVLIMSMMMTTCVSEEPSESTIEHCLKMKISSPAPATKRYQKMLDFGRVVCRDQFRIVGFSIRSRGKLPKHYLEALCNIYGDDQQKVNGYVKDNFFGYKPQELIGDETCVAIREKKKLLKAPPPSLKKLL